MRKRDITERYKRIKGVVKKIMHDPGRGAPLALIEFKNPIQLALVRQMLIPPNSFLR